MDLVGVEGHWTLTEHAMFRQNVLRDGVAKSCICPFRQVLRHSHYYSPPPEASGKGPDSSGQGQWASPFFSPGSLCVSGTRRGAPSGGGRLGSSLDFPRLNGCGGRA